MRGATAPDMELGHGIKGVVAAGPRDGVWPSTIPVLRSSLMNCCWFVFE